MVINKMFRLITQAFSQVIGSYPTRKAYNLSGQTQGINGGIPLVKSASERVCIDGIFN